MTSHTVIFPDNRGSEAFATSFVSRKAAAADAGINNVGRVLAKALTRFASRIYGKNKVIHLQYFFDSRLTERIEQIYRYMII